MSNYNDVYEFHKKFDLLAGTKPRRLTKRKLKERLEFLFEEFSEFAMGCGFILVTDENSDIVFQECDDQDLEEQADALIDLVYVAMGTGVMMGLPWEILWDDVQRANMSKVRGVTKRGHPVDVTKPEGWVGPKTGEILNQYGYDPDAPEVDDDLS